MSTLSQDLEKGGIDATSTPATSSPAARSSVDSHNRKGNDGDEQPVGRKITGLKWFLVCIAIFSANLLYGLDTTIAADIQASVSDSFENVTQLGWLGVGMALGSVCGILPLGKAYALFNTKWLFIGSLAMFAGGSALCGASPTMSAMIIGRVCAGVGGAGMYLGTLNLIAITTNPTETAVYVGVTGLVYGLGCILGPIIGGAFADSTATWRWAFYINLVIFGVMSPVYVFLLPSLPRAPETTTLQKIRSMDWLGIILNAAMNVCFVVAFTFGGAIWAWHDRRFIALSTLFVVFTAAFATTQSLCILTNKADRLFPCEFLRNRQLVLLYICMSCLGSSLFVTIYYVPFYYLFVHGESGTQAAIRLMPFICILVAVLVICGFALPRLGYHMVWYLACGLLIIAGAGAMYHVTASTPDAHVYGFTVILAFGMTVTQAGYDVATRIAPKDRIPEAIQFMNISQGQSQLLGLTIASALFQNEAFRGVKEILGGMGYADADIQQAITGSRSVLLQGLSPELNQRCLDVVIETISKEWILVLTAGALHTVCSLLMTRKRFP
ncbi:hypothetical protein jhhlp_000654 [Lomentospora prolificans]|uniref:Major facilitator superfamily (MFS) profile domain-containing protein n=1 Tax=Lomentospora prolificans TaxID=41688 RepID=A0A2N3NJ52_9PEZI|nr:hypothetical protein jhhlp_000654 [Lomentospora prolificans]